MSIKPEVLLKVKTYKRLLFFINLPLIVVIPIALEGGLIDNIHSQSVDGIYIALQLADFFMFFNSVLIYSTLKRVVSAIHYLPEEDKLVIKQFKSMFLGEQKIIVDPKDLISCKKKTLNPFVGYRSVTDNN